MDGKVNPSHYIWLAGDWDNLVYACKLCNGRKRNIFPIRGASPIGASIKYLRRWENAQLLDPCHDRPARHFSLRSDGHLVPLTNKGATTIRVLDLNRSHLLGVRSTVLSEFMRVLESVDLRSESDSVYRGIERLLDISRPHVGYLYLFLWHFSRKEGRRLLRKIEDQGVTRPLLTGLLRDLSRPSFSDLDRHWVPDEGELSSDLSDPAADFRIQQRKLAAIKISNFKGIHSAEIRFNGSSHESASGCDAIVGRNAMGKTSVLQAIALALMGPESANQVVRDARSFLKDGETSGSVIAYFHDTDQQNRVTFELGSRRFRGETGVRNVVLGYGAYRILAKSELQSRHVERTHRVKSLFGDNVRINGPHGWFAEVSEEAKRDAVTTLNVLLEGNETEASNENGRLQLKTRGQQHRFSSLSSGFQSIVSLVMDILDVLYAHRDSVLASEAVILIDELDAHLHPSWRLGIAQRLRKSFPAIHLIFSTHDPLTLRGLKRHDVQVLYRSDDGSIAVDDRENYADSYDVDQLLTSDLFGLYSTRDAATEKAMQEYYDLLSADGPLSHEEAAQRDKLEAQLNGDSPGKTKRERLLMRIIDSEIASRERNRPANEYDPEFAAHVQTLFRRAISDEESAQ
ncbi:AAA family ATPase [Paraburkholderia sp. A3BS-1L]|uniref:AAA family ATPase n=1 Tax=Paraburkholderia sp. A3BS-1L TaxID=3028375 RepID=UPI003DA93AB8